MRRPREVALKSAHASMWLEEVDVIPLSTFLGTIDMEIG